MKIQHHYSTSMLVGIRILNHTVVIPSYGR